MQIKAVGVVRGAERGFNCGIVEAKLLSDIVKIDDELSPSEKTTAKMVDV